MSVELIDVNGLKKTLEQSRKYKAKVEQAKLNQRVKKQTEDPKQPKFKFPKVKNAKNLEPPDEMPPEYKYTEYKENLIDGFSTLYGERLFKSEELSKDIKQSRDFRHGVESISDFDIENNYIGIVATLAGLTMKHYMTKPEEVKNNMNINNIDNGNQQLS